MLGAACAKTLWREVTDVTVRAPAAEGEGKQRREAGGRQKADSVGPCHGVPGLYCKSSGNH